jgi:hypothetical protein
VIKLRVGQSRNRVSIPGMGQNILLSTTTSPLNLAHPGAPSPGDKVSRTWNWTLCFIIPKFECVDPCVFMTCCSLNHDNYSFLSTYFQVRFFLSNKFTEICRNIREKSNGKLHDTFASTVFSRIPSQSSVLSTYTSRPTYNTISHEYHAQIFNRKPSTLYSMLQFTYPQQNVINIDRILSRVSC